MAENFPARTDCGVIGGRWFLAVVAWKTSVMEPEKQGFDGKATTPSAEVAMPNELIRCLSPLRPPETHAGLRRWTVARVCVLCAAYPQRPVSRGKKGR